MILRRTPVQYNRNAPSTADVVMHINRLRRAGSYHRDLVNSAMLKRFLPTMWNATDQQIRNKLDEAKLSANQITYLIESCQLEVNRCRARA